jgi:anti-sigma factor RsiW
MKKIPQQLEDTLLDYLDGKLDQLQRETFEQALKTNTALQDRLEELKKTDLALRELTADYPSKNFTATVMSRLDQYPSRAGLSIRNGILLLSGILAVMAIAVFLLWTGAFDHPSNLDLNNVSLVQRYIKQSLPSIPVDGKIMVNVIVLLNLALALIVLDRAILRPFFQRRMQTHP